MPKGHWDWSIPVPFSQGWKVDNLVFVGGQVSIDQNGNVIGEGDIEIQTRTTFQNITRVLDEAGATWKDVVKLNTFYVFEGPESERKAFWERMTRIRLEFLQQPGPVGTAVCVAGLAYPGLLIEAECIAIVNERR